MIMRVTGPIWSFDLGMSACGFAHGRPGEPPTSGSLALKRSAEPQAVAFWNLVHFINEQWQRETPHYVVKEKMLPLGAMSQKNVAEHVVRAHAGMHAIIEAMCEGFEVSWVDVADATVRKHFIGVARMGTRSETKAAVVKRCHMLGLMPKDCHDDNRADALAGWDYAAATVGRRHHPSLVLFGEEPVNEVGERVNAG